MVKKKSGPIPANEGLDVGAAVAALSTQTGGAKKKVCPLTKEEFRTHAKALTLTIEEVSPRTVGVLIALFERAVGLYASLVGINAYHQPGVEAGKKAAGEVLALQAKILAHFAHKPAAENTETIATAIGTDDLETTHKLCAHLAANGRLAREGRGPSAKFKKA